MDIQQIIKLLIQSGGTGDIDQLIAALNKLQTAQQSVNTTAKSTVDVGYDVGHTYDVMTTAIDKNAAATQWMTRQANELTAALDLMAEHERNAATATVTHTAAMNASATGYRTSGSAALQLSYIIDDLQYGLSAIVNNIPGFVLSMGGSAGLAGALGIAAVSVSVAVNHLKDLKQLFDDGLGTKLIDDVKSAEQALKDLTSKPWKTELDVRDIDIAKDKLDELNRAKRGYEGLNAPTADQKKRGDVVSEAIVEGGGRKALTEAVISATIGPMSVESQKILEEVEKLESLAKRAKEAGNEDAAIEYEGQAGEARRSLGYGKAVQEQNRRTAIEQQIGGAASGDEKLRAWLEGLVNANPAKFEAFGVDTTRLGAGLANASPENLYADERRKQAEAIHKKDLAKQAELARTDRDMNITKEKAEDAAAKKDAEVNATVEWIELWTGHNVLKGDADAAKKKDAAILQEKRLRDRAARQGGPTLAKLQRQQKRDQEAEYGQRFQEATGASDAQSMTAGHVMGGLIAKGATEQAAMATAYKRLLAELVQLGEINKRQEAQMLMTSGFFEDAARIIRQINASSKQGQFRMVRPTNIKNIQR